SPSPDRRTRSPSSTPAGIFTASVLFSLMRPLPEHVVQGVGMMLPLPWQRGQVCAIENGPCDTRTWPAPRQAAQVAAAKHGAATAAVAAEDIAEDVAEDVAQAGAARSRAGLRIHPGVAELVVGGALLRLAQHFVGFLRLLEVLLGLGIVRIAVRMPFHGEAAIGLLQVVF